MLQVYSNALTVSIPANGVAFVPFNNVAKDKGCDSALVAPGTVQINRQGVYPVKVESSLTTATAGDYILQLYVNGVARPESLTRVTLAAGSYSAASIQDLVTVPKNNTNCCYTSPTLLQVGVSNAAGTAADVTFANISEIVTRMC